MNTVPMHPLDKTIRDSVRDKYAAVARGENLTCCGSSGVTETINMIGESYDGVEGYVADADLKLGCGVPVEHAKLERGQTVLDLGSGAGIDAFVARQIVGESGHVIGVDFTPEMIQKARENASMLEYGNVEFRLGDIEAIPVEDASVDVIISNCVLNLVPNKAQAFAEMNRALRPGGHFCVSDIVSRGGMADEMRSSVELYAGCVAGAVEQEEYLAVIRSGGFDEVEVVAERPIELPESLLPPDSRTPIWSVTVRGIRPLN